MRYSSADYAYVNTADDHVPPVLSLSTRLAVVAAMGWGDALLYSSQCHSELQFLAG